MDTPVEVMNANCLGQLTSGNPTMVKEAAEGINDYTRMKMREDGFYRRILPMQTLPDSEMDRAVDTPLPVKIVDREPGSPAAVTIPFMTTPKEFRMTGDRYRVMFARIATPKAFNDVVALRTYHMDLRQVIMDNMIKDMLAEEDSKFLAACAAGLGTKNVTSSVTGTIMYKGINDTIGRDSWAEARKILPQTNARLEAATALINSVSVKELEKLDRTEVGGDLAQDIFINGWGERQINGVRVIVTNKTDLVPTGEVFWFAEPKFLGKSYAIEDATLWTKAEAFMLEAFAYECIGGAIGNVAGVARTVFEQSTSSNF